MKKKKIAKISEMTLFEMGDAMKVQRHQMDSAQEQCSQMEEHLTDLEELNQSNLDKCQDLFELEQEIKDACGILALEELNQILKETENKTYIADDDRNSVDNEIQIKIKRTEAIITGNSWENYKKNTLRYAVKNSIDLDKDPFLGALSQSDYEKLQNEINDDFAKKTSIFHKTDLLFLAVATALQVVKSVLFSVLSEKAGYGQGFDKSERLNHNDKSIKAKEKQEKEVFKRKQFERGNESGEWINILYRTPPYDITSGSPDIGFNMEGGYHRIHSLGHDPILGWIFGTANILTDTITFDTFATYKVVRNPMRITPQRVTLMELFANSLDVCKTGVLNLPAALASECIHLKSDTYTKFGLPVPIIETFAPDIAGKLYKSQYDMLCLSRDLKIVGSSGTVSLLVDMIIGLLHGLYYDSQKDGSRELFEVRTRKILLISNIIATTSNIIAAILTENPKMLDIGGIIVTVSHLFLDPLFMLRVKKEFLENRIYEKIETELQGFNETINTTMDFNYKHKDILGNV